MDAVPEVAKNYLLPSLRRVSPILVVVIANRPVPIDEVPVGINEQLAIFIGPWVALVHVIDIVGQVVPQQIDLLVCIRVAT